MQVGTRPVDLGQPGAAQVGTEEVGFLHPRAGQQRTAKVGVVEVGNRQHHLFQVTLAQVGTAKAGTVEPGKPQLQAIEAGIFQICSREVGIFDVGFLKVGPPEIGLDQTSTGKVGLIEVSTNRMNRSEIGPAQVSTDGHPGIEQRPLEIGTLKSGSAGMRFFQVRRAQVGLFQVRRFKVDSSEVQSRPRRSSEIGPAQPGSTIRARAPARHRGVEQARRHGMNRAMLTTVQPFAQVLQSQGVPRDRQRGLLDEIMGKPSAESRFRVAALGDVLDPIGGQQKRDRAVPDQAKQLLRQLRTFRHVARQCGKREVQDRVGILSDTGQTEILGDRPRAGMFVEPFRQLASYCRTDVDDRFIACHPIEHDGPELGNALEETAIVGRLQPSHHRGAAIPMGRQQVLDDIVLAPGGEGINDLARGGRQPTAGGNDEVTVSVSESDDIGITLGIVDQPHLGQGPRG